MHHSQSVHKFCALCHLDKKLMSNLYFFSDKLKTLNVFLGDTVIENGQFTIVNLYSQRYVRFLTLVNKILSQEPH